MRVPIPRPILSLLIATAGIVHIARAQNPGAEVAVVYSRQIPASKSVAEYYAEKRKIPPENLIEIDVPQGDVISRAAFRDQMERPLHQALQSKGLMKFDAAISPASKTQPGSVRYVCVASKIRYMVLCWGLPYKIANDPKLIDSPGESPAMSRNNACVDNDLCLLPVLGNFVYLGAIKNVRAFDTQIAAAIHPTNQLLMVTRLDGPSPEIAKGMVDRALQAEEFGLWGRAYFDLRNIGGDYARGDQYIQGASRAAQLAGFQSYADVNPAVFPMSFPLSDVAIYVGWYSGHADGPFARPTVEFQPGAIAYHIHSYSAADVRSTNLYWVGPLLSRGATVTAGCVDEPYLTLTPDFGICLSRLFKGWTWGEAMYASMPAVSWQTVVMGDPLYRPGARSAANWVEILKERNDPHLQWAILAVANQQLGQRVNPTNVIEYLEAQPLTAKSPVLQEKLAEMKIQRGDKMGGIQSYQNAANLDCSPMQKLRVLLELGLQQATGGQRDAAYSTYARAIKECHEWIDQLDVRRRQLALARDLQRTQDIPFLEGEVNRLGAPRK